MIKKKNCRSQIKLSHGILVFLIRQLQLQLELVQVFSSDFTYEYVISCTHIFCSMVYVYIKVVLESTKRRERICVFVRFVWLRRERESRERKRERDGKRESWAEEDREQDQQASDFCKTKEWAFEESLWAICALWCWGSFDHLLQ